METFLVTTRTVNCKNTILHQTALGLGYLHSHGYIHRNIHGRNVLVTEIHNGNQTHYVAKLSDFRFCQNIFKDSKNSPIQSQSDWIAPEMMDPEAQLGPWTDIFILGCFFYYVLSKDKKHPFGENKLDREKNICNRRYKIPFDDNSTSITNENYRKLIVFMTSFKAKDRPSIDQIVRNIFKYDTAAPQSSTPSAEGNFVPIYDSVNHQAKPGLCVIIQQDTFNKVMEKL